MIELELLQSSYWEHYKKAKDLAMVLPLNHPRRLEVEKELNNLIPKINKIKKKLNIED